MKNNKRKEKLTKLKTFYNGKRVFLTGHTGLKGSWLSLMLKELGADVYGFSLAPNTTPDLFTQNWGPEAKWEDHAEPNAPHEASFLKLDCAKARATFGWEPVWYVDNAIVKTVAWYKAWNDGENMYEFTRMQICDFWG